MSDNFSVFATQVVMHFRTITAAPNVFVVNVDGDALFQDYLNAFPEGTNPIFNERTEHDCSCCKQFIRRAGTVVAGDADGTVQTVWGEAAKSAPYPYNKVAEALQARVRAANIGDLFLVNKNEVSFGAKVSRSLGADGKAITWNHLHTGEIPGTLRSATAGQSRGDYRTTVQVFERGLVELKPEAVSTVLSLVEANSLYRGEEHKPALVQFAKAQRAYLEKDPRERSLFAWAQAHGPAARFRNTVIGTLVQDLSEGMDDERAVASFEAKVAPQNYKRTTALITPRMIEKALEKIAELGLEPALERRFARIGDISVNDVLWVDSGIRPLMKGGLNETLMKHAASAVNRADDAEKAEDITIDKFMKEVLPKATGLELLFKNGHLGNLMSLTAPVHPEPKQLFRWTNDFAWSYGGNVADSIKERVKRAGGRIEGVALRASLSWFNYDDLDLHAYEPEGRHIFYGNRKSASGGWLDVDMNVVATTREAVENISWPKVSNGVYRITVHNFNLRERFDMGFAVQVATGGKLSNFNYCKAVAYKEEVEVVKLHVRDGVVESLAIGKGISTEDAHQEQWGLRTGQYVKVTAVTLSPNYWGSNAVGNKHTCFVLDGARNDEPTRGIYNEFLHTRLEEHRKVFEVIGEKTKCQPTEGQLSGLGFSSTKQDSVTVKVTQAAQKQRLFNVRFGA